MLWKSGLENQSRFQFVQLLFQTYWVQMRIIEAKIPAVKLLQLLHRSRSNGMQCRVLARQLSVPDHGLQQVLENCR